MHGAGAGAGAGREGRPGVARAHYQEADAPFDWFANGPAGNRHSLFMKWNIFVEKSSKWQQIDAKQLKKSFKMATGGFKTTLRWKTTKHHMGLHRYKTTNRNKTVKIQNNHRDTLDNC